VSVLGLPFDATFAEAAAEPVDDTTHTDEPWRSVPVCGDTYVAGGRRGDQFAGLAAVWIFLAGATEWFKLGPDVSFRWGQSIARVVLGAAAFLLWSFAVPGSPSRSWSLVADISDAALSVAVVLAAALFGMVAALAVGLLDRYFPSW
jgi:hypothetical protein